MLFVGAAISITAFPVLARILEEHGLVGTPVGSLAVSCAAVNDVLSWIALALALAANSSLERRSRWRSSPAPRSASCSCSPCSPRLADRRQRLHGAARLPWWLAILVVGTASPARRSRRTRSGLHYVFGAFAFGVLFARPSLAPLAAGPIRVATVVGLLLLPLYLVLPGATTDFRDLDLRATAARSSSCSSSPPASKLVAGALLGPRGPASPATTRSRSACC